MRNEQFSALVDDLKSDRSYQHAKAKIDFASSLWRVMQQRNVSNSELAARIGKSRAWITKVLSGDCNFTIETMVDLADAVGGKISLHIADSESRTRWLEEIDGKLRRPSTWEGPMGDGVTMELGDEPPRVVA